MAKNVIPINQREVYHEKVVQLADRMTTHNLKQFKKLKIEEDNDFGVLFSLIPAYTESLEQLIFDAIAFGGVDPEEAITLFIFHASRSLERMVVEHNLEQGR